MKFLRNLLIATTAVAAMSATAAFADAAATYTDGTVAVTGVDTKDFGDQVTVVIVPKGTTSVTEDKIYYINQDDQTGITTILAGMGMKELATTDPTEYEVWIGGTNVSEETPIIKIDFATAASHPDKPLGDANLSGLTDSSDATVVLNHAAKIVTLTGDALKCADANKSGLADSSDATVILNFAAKILGSLEW